MKRPVTYVCLILFLAAGRLWAASQARVDFETDVQPILSDRCFVCHGPDEESREADLRLDRHEDALRRSETGDGTHVIRPGDPQHSELFLRIASEDDDLRMPPIDSNLSLTDKEIALLRAWIEQGAPWTEHWAFVPPRDVPVPEVTDKAWPRSEIDYFILRRLERQGLAPSPEARRQTLIRRLSFDLTGLPPTLAEIDEFLADSSPEAYERLVDRLLRCERYGERMASDWLDVARYSDTYGYQVDRDRLVWPWRDWVIRALNDNMPYDQFLTQQLAGDLLPQATDDQILATTFNRLHPQKVEGGSVPEEFRVEYVADRVQTFATSMLGLTMECARCHDHKYDPLTQKEYYQLGAFFDNIDEAGLYSYFTQAVPTPTLLMVDEAKKAELARLAARTERAESRLAEIRAGHQVAYDAWFRRRARGWPASALNHVTNSTGSSTTSEPAAGATTGATAERADHLPQIPGQIAQLDFEAQKQGPNQSVPGRVGRAVRLTGDDGIELKVGNFRRCQPFSVALWMNTPGQKQRAVVFHRSRAWTDAASRGYQLLIEQGRLSASLIHFWPGNAIRVKTREEIPTNQWLHVAVTYDGSSRAGGLKIYVNGRPAACEVIRDHLYKNITGGGGDNITIGQRFRDRGFTGGLVDEFRVFDRELSEIEVAQLHDKQSLNEALRGAANEITGPRREPLYAYYLRTVDSEYRKQLKALCQARRRHNEACDSVPEIMVMRELAQRRPTYVLRRGAYDARGQQVTPGTPAVLPSMPANQPRNRLGLARWLTAPEHPLTARVAVNRFWQVVFGRGLVRTPEDFGSQGQRPTHPELLDWLARDFVANGWNTKRLLKQMVTSATYRQSSVVSSELRARDPENRLLARFSCYRLPAEMLRDNALAVSGLLVQRVGGPPARPYELEASFKPSKPDSGDGLYRRSLYTYWTRTGPAPVMMTLDAAKRDVCRMHRERTASPLQALVLMNSPQRVEAARVLGQRLIEKHADDTEAVLSDMFRMLTSRRPTDAEAQVLQGLYSAQLRYFKDHATGANQYLKIGNAPADPGIEASRLAATAVVANTLLNYDRCVMKR